MLKHGLQLETTILNLIQNWVEISISLFCTRLTQSDWIKNTQKIGTKKEKQNKGKLLRKQNQQLKGNQETK